MSPYECVPFSQFLFVDVIPNCLRDLLFQQKADSSSLEGFGMTALEITVSCLRSQSLRNRQSSRTLSAESLKAPVGWRATVRHQPLPLLYRKMCRQRDESAKSPPVPRSSSWPAEIRPRFLQFLGQEIQVAFQHRPERLPYPLPRQFASRFPAPAAGYFS